MYTIYLSGIFRAVYRTPEKEVHWGLYNHNHSQE